MWNCWDARQECQPLSQPGQRPSQAPPSVHPALKTHAHAQHKGMAPASLFACSHSAGISSHRSGCLSADLVCRWSGIQLWNWEPSLIIANFHPACLPFTTQLQCSSNTPLRRCADVWFTQLLPIEKQDQCLKHAQAKPVKSTPRPLPVRSVSERMLQTQARAGTHTGILQKRPTTAPVSLPYD